MEAGPANPPGASPLRRGYLASNPRLIALLAAGDALLRIVRRQVTIPIPTAPRRVLLAVGGHLGDAVIATAAIEHLRRCLPDADIGVAMPSWSRVVLEGDPRLRWIHVIDHWKPSRSGGGRLARWRQYNATRRRALREIRAVGYDVAVDLYGYFPNMAFTLSQSMIPVRLGFASGGLGPLYTHAFPWGDDLRQVGERQVELVSMLASSGGAVRPIRYALPETSHGRAASGHVAAILLERKLERGAYIVIHPGTGAARREWAVAEWRNLAHQLAAEGHRLVFTGRGVREASVLKEITSGVVGATNLCDALDWHELVEVIRHARLVISVETATAHVAAAVDTPCVALWTNTINGQFWRPVGSHVTLVMAPSTARALSTAEAPAFTANMLTVRDIAPREVLDAVHDMLAATARGASAGAELKAQGVR